MKLTPESRKLLEGCLDQFKVIKENMTPIYHEKSTDTEVRCATQIAILETALAPNLPVPAEPENGFFMFTVPDSSMIARIGHYPSIDAVRIVFKADPEKNKAESVYDYRKVPPADWDALFNAESVGQHFLKKFKPAFTDFLKVK